MEKSLRLNLQGRIIDVVSGDAAFLAYVKKQFFYHIVESAAAIADISVRVSFSLSSLGKNLAVEGESWRRIATNTYIAGKECVYMDKINARRTKVHCSLEGRQLCVSALQETKRRWPFAGADEEQMRRACYHFIYCPLFFYLQHFHNTHPLHAGAFTLFGKSFVLVGLDKMGKTTLSLESLKLPGGSFISDNIVFHDERSITPCYAPLKLRVASDLSVPDTFRRITQEKEKVFYAPPASSERALCPDMVIIPSFCREAFIKEIPSSEAREIIMNTNALSSEMKDYFNAVPLWSLLAGAEALWVKQHTALATLLKQARCYQLGIARHETPRETLERLAGLIK